MSSAITALGQTRINQLRGEEKPLVIDRMVLALVPGLDSSQPVDRNQQMPDPAHVVHTYSIDGAHKGYVNPDQVVYSMILGSDVGNFSFNWIGTVEAVTGNVITVTTTPETPKRKTDLGTNTTGNNITRNVMMRFQDAQALTGVSVSAETWQFDYTAELAEKTAQATENKRGTTEIASQPEVDAGADDARTVTPKKLWSLLTRKFLRLTGGTLVGDLILNGSKLFFENGDHCITNNDGGGNFNIRVNSTPSAQSKYVQDSGAHHVTFLHEGCDPYVSFRLADAGVAGESIPWIDALKITKDGIYPRNKSNRIDLDSDGHLATSSAVAAARCWKNIKGRPSTFLPSNHTHPPAEAGLGNLPNAISDSVTTNSSAILASAKAAKTAYDKGTAAYNAGTRQATESLRGQAEIATQGEVDACTDDARIVTPKKLWSLLSRKFLKLTGGTVDGLTTFKAGLSTNGRPVYSSKSANSDYIWHDDGSNTWHLVSDSKAPTGASGNSKLQIGQIIVNGEGYAGPNGDKRLFREGDESNSVTSTSSHTVATSKAVKTAYDKAISVQQALAEHNTVKQKGSRSTTGAWTIAGVEPHKPLIIVMDHTSSEGKDGGVMYSIKSGAIGGHSNSGTETFFALRCDNSPSWQTVSGVVVIPTATSVVLNLHSLTNSKLTAFQ